MSIALGPLGRNGEALGSLNTSGKMAAMYSYSKTRGLFGGVSVEGSVIVERQDANAQAYHSDVSVKQLLSGSVDPPEWAQPLINTLEACVGLPGGQKWVDDSADASPGPKGSDYVFGGGVASPGSDLPTSLRKKYNSASSPFPPPSWGRKKSGGSYFTAETPDGDNQVDYFQSSQPNGGSHALPEKKLVDVGGGTSGFETKFESDFVPSPIGEPGHRQAFSVTSWSSNPSGLKASSPFAAPRSPGANSTSGSLSHSRSVSAASYLASGNNRGLGASANAPSTSNPFASRANDPFAYESNGDTIDDYNNDRDRSASLLRNKPHSPLSPSHGLSGIGRAIALYDFNPVEVRSIYYRE